MSQKFNMDDYVPVNERIEQFYKAHPEGSIQSEIVELTGSRVTVRAYAYRTPADPRPGIGHSSLDIPGSTPYTRGSEVENAETSAWGRAIAALGFEVKRGIASAEEVRNKTQAAPSSGRPATGAGGASAPPSRSPAPAPSGDEMPEFPPPLDEEPPEEVVPFHRQSARTNTECPEHGPSKVKRNKRGLYCATKVGDGWCEWSVAA